MAAFTNEQHLLGGATGYIYYYNNLRFAVPIMLDTVAVALGP